MKKRIINPSKMYSNRKKYHDENVYHKSLERVRYCYDNFSEVMVACSGGKDSSVILDLAIQVAKEKNKLPVKVLFLDQEVEWGATVEYMKKLHENPDIRLYWFQIPFDLWNTLSLESKFLSCWDESCRDLWVHEKMPYSIHTNDFYVKGKKVTRFHDLLNILYTKAKEPDSDLVCVLSGLRAEESLSRRMKTLGTNKRGNHNDISWLTTRKGSDKVMAYPIYDYTFDDIWIYIENRNVLYNEIYDKFYRHNIPIGKFRVSALIHETAYHSVLILQELEPEVYNRFFNRIHDVSTFSHLKDDLYPKELPYMFSDWKEYRDYLLDHLIPEEDRDIFRKRWIGQDSERFYKSHVREVCINDIDGTINTNTKFRMINEDGKAQFKKFEEKRNEEI